VSGAMAPRFESGAPVSYSGDSAILSKNEKSRSCTARQHSPISRPSRILGRDANGCTVGRGARFATG